MNELDYEIIPIVIMIFILGLVLPKEYFLWAAGIIFIVPQFRIYVRAFWDYRKFKRPKGKYLLVNEAFVSLSCLLFIAIKVYVF